MKKLKKDELICLSCNKTIKAKNLNRHSKSKIHNKNVKKKVDRMKKFTFDPDIVEEDLKYIYQREEWENEIKEMELNNKIIESRNIMNNRTD